MISISIFAIFSIIHSSIFALDVILFVLMQLTFQILLYRKDVQIHVEILVTVWNVVCLRQVIWLLNNVEWNVLAGTSQNILLMMILKVCDCYINHFIIYWFNFLSFCIFSGVLTWQSSSSSYLRFRIFSQFLRTII